jgi:DNA-binding LacI/PurR family transcriptional regulator
LDVDGVIIADPREGDPALSVLNRVGIPVVSIERDLRRTDGWWVQTDSDASTRTMLDHLSQQGAERIALVTIEGPWAWFEDTTAAYDGWCRDRGRRPIVRLIDPERPRETAELAMRELLGRRPAPDAVFAVPFGAPQGVLDAAAGMGVRVPDDLLVAAGIDSQTLQVSNPPVTALDLRPIEMARAAVDLLARRVAGEYQAGPANVIPDLVVRRSTCPTR